MARVFTITAPSSTIHLDAKGRGELAFTVANASGRRLRGRAVLVAQHPSQKAWLTLTPEVERDFNPGGLHQFTVHVVIPAGSAEGNYTFRLDAFSVHNPDEDYSQGPTVAFTVARQKEPKHFTWWLVAAAAMLLVVGGWAAAYFLLGRNVKVPDVVSSDIVTANATLQNAKLRAEEASRVLSEGKLQDTVLSQSPRAGDKVRSGSVVQLTVADAGTSVPNVLGYARRGAINAMEAAKLQVNEVTRSVSEEPAGIIIDQDPKAGGLVKLGTLVTIGVNDLVKVPEVVGMNVEAAKNALTSANLTLGEVTTRTADEGVTGIVASQNPPAGSMAAIRAAVRLEAVHVRPKPVGCDGVAGSGKVVDNCGVCGGDNACFKACRAQTVTLKNADVAIYLDLPQTDVGGALNWSDTGVYTVAPAKSWEPKFIIGMNKPCSRVAISGLSYSCQRTPGGGKWVEKGNVIRDGACINSGNSNQPYMRIERRK